MIVSGFPSPDLPIEERPWKVGNGMCGSRTLTRSSPYVCGSELSEEEFKDEARGWDVTEDVFRDDLWLENVLPLPCGCRPDKCKAGLELPCYSKE